MSYKFFVGDGNEFGPSPEWYPMHEKTVLSRFPSIQATFRLYGLPEEIGMSSNLDSVENASCVFRVIKQELEELVGRKRNDSFISKVDVFPCLTFIDTKARFPLNAVGMNSLLHAHEEAKVSFINWRITHPVDMDVYCDTGKRKRDYNDMVPCGELRTTGDGVFVNFYGWLVKLPTSVDPDALKGLTMHFDIKKNHMVFTWLDITDKAMEVTSIPTYTPRAMEVKKSIQYISGSRTPNIYVFKEEP